MQSFEIQVIKCARSQLRDILYCLLHTIYTHCFYENNVKMREYILFNEIVFFAIDDPKLLSYIDKQSSKMAESLNFNNNSKLDILFYDDYFLSFCCFQEKPIIMKWTFSFDFVYTMKITFMRERLFELVETVENNETHLLHHTSKLKYVIR